jgi:single-strand DNA-binding protein
MANIDVAGNLTRDPELRFLPNGTAVANFSLAESRKWTDKNGDTKEETSFHEIVAWGTLGENVSESLAKGMRAVVTGRLKQESWDGEDGKKRYAMKIHADEIGPSLRWTTAEVVRSERSSARSEPADY